MRLGKATFYEKFYMWLLVLLPVLAQYKVGPLDLDTVLMAGFFLVSLMLREKLTITPIGRSVLGIICYIAVITVINLVFGQKFSPVADIVLRMGRYCLYLVVVFCIGNDCVTYERLMRIYRFVAYAATFYIILQAIFFYGAGITLPNKIGGSSVDARGEFGRLRAFYSEPAELGYNLTPFIACSLFGENAAKGKNKGSFDAVWVSLAIILSTSGQGIIGTAIIWAVWLFMRIKCGEFKKKDLLLLVGVAVVAVVLYKIGILKFALDRASDTNEGGAMDARSSGYDSLVLLSPLQRLFGSGFGNFVVENTFGLNIVYEYVNYSTLSEFLFTLGICGVLIWLMFFAGVFLRGSLCTRTMMLALFFLATGGCPMTGKHFPLWLTLMCVQLPEGQFSYRKKELPEETNKTN